LCSVKSLSFAVGLYLPLSTTLPIWVGGAMRGLTDWMAKRKGEEAEDADLGKGSLFATGLVAGGALAGVVVALLQASEGPAAALESVNLEHGLTGALGASGYQILGTLFFVAMAAVLVRTARKK
jgi:hypothetical protein